MFVVAALMVLLASNGPAAPVISTEAKAAADEFRDDGPKLIERLEALAAAGDASASEFLGEIYSSGEIAGIARDPAKACDRFARTADRRGDSAQNLATCYFRGDGRSQDFARARIEYRRAGKMGWPKADCALGNMLIAGQGGAADIPGGLALCRHAAEAGDADAQADIGNYLLGGKVVPRDIVAARKWYERAAGQGQANAAFVLGQIYWNGDGTPVDRTSAGRWWRTAWDGGRKDAAALLVGEVLTRLVVDGGASKSIDWKVLPEARLWIGRAASDDPDLSKRKEFTDLLRQLPQDLPAK